MIKFIRNVKLPTRIFIFLIIFTVFPSLFLFFHMQNYVNKIWYDYTDKYILSSEHCIENNLELVVNKINIFYLKLITNKLLQSYADDFTIPYEERQQKIYETVKESLSPQDEKINGHIITNRGEVFELSPSSITYKNDIKYIDEINKSTMAIWGDTVFDQNNNPYLPYGRRFLNFNSMYTLGIVILYIPEQDIYQTYKDIILDKGTICILNEHNTVMSSNVKELVHTNLFIAPLLKANLSHLQIFEFNGTKYLLSNYCINNVNKNIPENLRIVSLLPQGIYFSLLDNFNKIVYFFEILIISLSAIIALYFSRKIVSPLIRLEKNMYRFGHGDMNITIPFIDKGDEISNLQNIYSSMLTQIKRLIIKNNEEKEKQMIAEYKALQAQIKPHFIYNTLDAISWMARMKAQTDIEEIVHSLSSFFRISLHNGDKFITVEEEITHVKSYVTIEQIRFPDRIKFEYEIESDMLQYYIIKTILQPIVENSIKHGFNNIRKKGRIIIKGYKQDNQIVFEIIDNGKGFDTTILNDSSKSGYGIKNVIERIKLEYKNDGKIEFYSKIGKGTKVLISVKIEIKE